jgi:glycosyltransferase involved in cell wall biosynthesis
MRTILFVTLDEFSNISSSLEGQLRKHFPDHEIETLVLKSKLKKDYIILFLSVLAVFPQHFVDFVIGNKSLLTFRKHLYHTPFIMRYFNRKIGKRLTTRKYAFIFQTQSVFDTSSLSTPNFIYTDHTNLNNLNYPLINPARYLSSKTYIKMEWMIYEHATLLFVMSSNIKDSLVQQYGISPDKVKLVYAGSNTKILPDVNPKKYANKNILFVGKDWERKGGPLLVEAFEHVLQEIPDATLTIIGSNPRISIRNCTVVENVPVEQVSAYYNEASVFCLPTKREPFGIVFIEAMLNHLPIVTNSIGATPELVLNNENGFRLNYDAREYADTLIQLLNDPIRCEQMGERSYQLAQANYTWDNTGRLIGKYIKEKLASRGTIQI